MTEQRRLAAILIADVVGYAKLVGSDEAGTLAKLQALRAKVIEPAVAKHVGSLFKAVGDGFLVEFALPCRRWRRSGTVPAPGSVSRAKTSEPL